MALDPQAQKFLEILGDPPPLDTISPEQNRAAMAAAISLTGPRTELADVQDLRIETVTGPVPVRVYRPDLAAGLPATTYFHGGGWVAGTSRATTRYAATSQRPPASRSSRWTTGSTPSIPTRPRSTTASASPSGCWKTAPDWDWTRADRCYR